MTKIHIKLPENQRHMMEALIEKKHKEHPFVLRKPSVSTIASELLFNAYNALSEEEKGVSND